MLYIYNETQKAFQVKQLSDTAVRINKVTIKEDKENTQFPINKKSVNMLVHASIFPDINLANLNTVFDNCVEMRDMRSLSGMMGKLVFNHKDLAPFYTARSDSDMHVIMVSLSLRGKRIADISYGQKDTLKTYLTEGYIFNGELTAIFTTSPDISNPLTITLVNNQSKQIEKYYFSEFDGNLVLAKECEDIVSDDQLPPKTKIVLKRSRPRVATKTIITTSDDINNLKAAPYGKKFFDNHDFHIIRGYAQDDVDNVVDALHEFKIMAVTFYYTVETPAINELREYLKSKFRIYFEMTNKGVTQVKL